LIILETLLGGGNTFKFIKDKFVAFHIVYSTYHGFFECSNLYGLNTPLPNIFPEIHRRHLLQALSKLVPASNEKYKKLNSTALYVDYVFGRYSL
jgi:hypothetical protein